MSSSIDEPPGGDGLSRGTARTYRDLPLLWKLLIPFLVLMLVAGVLGTFLIVGDLSERAETAMLRDLSEHSLTARSRLHDRELYLVESANLAVNLQGMAEATGAGDRDEVERLLLSVVALKADLSLVAVADRSGTLASFVRKAPSGRPRPEAVDLTGEAFLRNVFRSRSGRKSSGFARLAGTRMLGLAAPICAAGPICDPVGMAVVGVEVRNLAEEASVLARSATPSRQKTVAIYDGSGTRWGVTGVGLPSTVSDRLARRPARVVEPAGEQHNAMLFTPYTVQGRRIGTLAVGLPTTALVAARATAWRLGVVLLGVMAGVAIIGAWAVRSIVAQVRPLVETNQALGAGDLSARAPVMSHDEIGQLARGVNEMADRLQASHETLEERVVARTREIERLLKERTEFFAALSHDLRTPLAVILAQADLLAESEDQHVVPSTSESATTIKHSADQLLSVVNDILELAKAESGALEVDLRETSLTAIVDGLAATNERLATMGGLELVVDLPDGLPPVLADPPHVQKILLNLVGNAVKYTPPGGMVHISAAVQDERVAVAASDTGLGIPEEAGDRIFEPFYRVKETSAQGGQPSTGLGLALTKRLVEAHGGDISFTSQPGAGTTFTFTLRSGETTPPEDGALPSDGPAPRVRSHSATLGSDEG